VVEIPTGTTAKWEVVKPSGELNWKFSNGKPRRVKYLGYPCNYGMVPRTIMPKELGGDGDPIDVLVLGPPVARGSVVQAKLIGVLKMIDKGEQDDKLIAVLRDTPFYTSPSIKELDETFLGVTDIIQIWFTNYKGPDRIETEGFGDEIEARRILQSAINAFNQSQEK
jgi:inorganic pyrophosphatase